MGIRVNTSFKGIDFDFKQFKKSVEVSMIRQRNNALREFLEVILSQIPVLTGTAAGTLAPIGRIVNRAVHSRIHPKKVRNGRGPSVGDDPIYSSIDVGNENGKAWFSWDLNLDYFIYNDRTATPGIYPNGQRSTPWGLIKQAQEAALAHLAKYAKKDIPKVSQFIRKIK